VSAERRDSHKWCQASAARCVQIYPDSSIGRAHRATLLDFCQIEAPHIKRALVADHIGRQKPDQRVQQDRQEHQIIHRADQRNRKIRWIKREER
jgi:hypothetical protein